MQSNSTNKEQNKAIAQLKYAIDESFIKNKYNYKWIFDRVGNIESQVKSTKYLQHDSANTGCNALNYAAEHWDIEAYIIMIKNGVDFTIQDEKGSTVLMSTMPLYHEFERGVKDLFVEFTLQAHMTYDKSINPCELNGFSHFHIACMANDVDAVEYFLQNGTSVHQSVNANGNEYDKKFGGYTPLHFSVEFGALETVDTLLEYKADLYLKDAEGLTPWHILLKKNFKILNEKASAASRIFRQATPKSIRKTNEDIMEMLLYHNSNNKVVKAIDETGLTHFHVACSIQDTWTAENFLEIVSNLNHCISMESPLWPGYSALHFAAFFNVETVKLLAEKGADIEIQDALGVTPLNICLERYKSKDIHEILSRSAVWKSIVFSDGHTELLNFISALQSIEHLNGFLAKDMNIFIPVDSPRWPGYTALHIAVKIFPHKYNNGNDEAEHMDFGVIKELLSRGCDINAQDVHGWTPLHLAFRLGKESLAKFLLESETNVINVVDEDNLSHLHIACALNKTSAVEELLRSDMNVDIVYRGTAVLFCVQPDSTPLHFATANKSSESVEILLKYGANIYAKDARGMTPIHLTVAFRQLKSIGNILLLSPYLEDSVIDDAGLSHLHVAVIHDNAAAVKKLLERKADVHRKIIDASKFDNYTSEVSEWKVGMSAIHLAMGTRSKEIIELLIQHGADILDEPPHCRAPLYAFFDWQETYKDCSEVFLSALKGSVALQKRAELDIGLTMLHVACFEVNVQLVEDLLQSGTDVNAQIRSGSPIWPGQAPLHILSCSMRDVAHGLKVNTIVSKLLAANADPLLPNATQRTPIMWASMHPNDDQLSKLYRVRLRLMLNKITDFNVNPVDPKGFSHFHVACAISEPTIIRKYLESGAVDVNSPIDFMSEFLGGCTPLHLVARCKKNVVGASAQLEAADLLLKHGADVHAEDSIGNTPLHDVARFDSNCEDLFERLIKSGAGPNARNVIGQTPLEYLLLRDNVSVTELKFFLLFGCHIQTFNPVTRKGYLAMTLDSIVPSITYNFIFKILTNSPRLLDIDNAGQTSIHNLVSSSGSDRTHANSYVRLINLLEKGGCHVDDQDELGRTALHVASVFRNDKAVAGLLKSGADINITDKNGQTAFNYLFEDCTRCQLDEDDGSDHTQFHHLKLFKMFVGHVKKLQYCELEVNRVNEGLVSKTLKKFSSTDMTLKDHFEGEMEKARITTVGPLSMKLAEFLSETWAVVAYPKSPQLKRDIIDDFFLFHENLVFWNPFEELCAVFQLQHRKAVERLKLIKHAEKSLVTLIKYRLPVLCNWNILDFLRNSDLETLIKSVKI